MNPTIWKFALIPGVQVLPMPVGAQALSVGMQDDTLVLWVLVRPDAAKELRMVTVLGTGWDVKTSPGKFIGTVQHPNGLVWHVFVPTDAWGESIS